MSKSHEVPASLFAAEEDTECILMLYCMFVDGVKSFIFQSQNGLNDCVQCLENGDQSALIMLALLRLIVLVADEQIHVIEKYLAPPDFFSFCLFVTFKSSPFRSSN